ncbi:uncharacterized protein LOC119168731 isoform X2 [Rhipicephalus microplus]|uniref:uncharacterized protein LOC119168731 isoform X2 n=1 Tax=Rhipicephalus microplus TaxID=6941 RepID=UPI003F6AAFCF
MTPASERLPRKNRKMVLAMPIALRRHHWHHHGLQQHELQKPEQPQAHLCTQDSQFCLEQCQRCALPGGCCFPGATRGALYRPVHAVQRRSSASPVPVLPRRSIDTLLPIRTSHMPAGQQHRQGPVLHDGHSGGAGWRVQPVVPDTFVEQQIRVLQRRTTPHVRRPGRPGWRAVFRFRPQ